MTDDISDFTDALARYVRDELAASGEPADYNNEAVEVADARNHLFRRAGRRATEEADNVYALRDLCCVDGETMELVPDVQRIARVARNFF